VGVIGGAKKDLPGKFRTIMRWVQRVLALAVILVALVYSNPGIFTYEIAGSLFRLIGSTFLFALLGIILITALFIKRPWCNYLCPVRPVVDFIRLIRNWVLRRNS
jgi:polyferredoxin